MTLFAWMHQALSSDKSLSDAVRRVNTDRIAEGKTPASSNTAAFSNARMELSAKMVRALFHETALQLDHQMREAFGNERVTYKGRGVKVMDGSTLSMPDTEENQREFPQIASQEDGSGFPIARIAVIFSLFSGAALDLAIGPYKGKESGEHALLRQLLHCFVSGDITLGDSYYASYFLMANLHSLGVDFLFHQHGARKTDFRSGTRLGKGDHITTLKKPPRPDWMSDELYALMPDTMDVRELRVTVHQAGFRSRTVTLVTSLLSPKQDSKRDLGTLYACRWSVELYLRDIKTTMAMNTLRCKTPAMIKKEIWIYLLAYNVIRKMMAESALKKGVEPWQISFKATIQTFVHYSTLWRDKKIDKGMVYQYLLDAIASRIVGNRPGRSEPRKRKRRAKPFPLLHGQRHPTLIRNGQAPRQKLQNIQNKFIERQVRQDLGA